MDGVDELNDAYRNDIKQNIKQKKEQNNENL